MASCDSTDLPLAAVSPLDGRYASQTRALAAYFSEFALIRYRLRVEIEWYLALARQPEIDMLAPLDARAAASLRAIYESFSTADAAQVKGLEATTNHDVKAVEYFLKRRIGRDHFQLPIEVVHFACTSEDINNLAYALILKDFLMSDLLPRLDAIVSSLSDFADRNAASAMISRTHGQAATPTTVGKEFAVFAHRLRRQVGHLRRQEFLGKINGAVGNYNAHHAAYPNVDWLDFSRRFVESLGLVWNPLTTQIESHDWMAELFDTTSRVCTIMLSLSRDLWSYISLGYLRQQPVAGEVGSSTMPHKINPIDLENCEGNTGLAIALLQHLSAKLPVSRLQRDLSDSTVLRSLGSAFAYVVVALNSFNKGFGKLSVDENALAADLEAPQSWEVLAEAIQTLMRRYGLPEPYETLKELTRGRAINPDLIKEIISSLPLDASVKSALSKLSPASYVGLAERLTRTYTRQ
jgi:adenylosuccinate lyase